MKILNMEHSMKKSTSTNDLSNLWLCSWNIIASSSICFLVNVIICASCWQIEKYLARRRIGTKARGAIQDYSDCAGYYLVFNDEKHVEWEDKGRNDKRDERRDNKNRRTCRFMYKGAIEGDIELLVLVRFCMVKSHI
jgi:hypothetical protein